MNTKEYKDLSKGYQSALRTDKKTKSNPRLTNEEFLEKLKEVKPNYEALEPYVKSQIKILFNCKTCNHDPFYATPNNMLKKSYGGCPICGNISRRNTKRTESGIGIENLEKRIKEKYPDGLYTLVSGQTYVNNKTAYKIRCKKCKRHFKCSPVNLLRNDRPRGCPHCNSIKNDSKGVKAIIAFLDKHKLKYIREATFDDCIFKKNLKFDFKVYKDDKSFVLIEFDGELHERAYYGYITEDFINTQKRDKIKDDYCAKNGIRLIRISYHNMKDIDKILSKEFKLV